MNIVFKICTHFQTKKTYPFLEGWGQISSKCVIREYPHSFLSPPPTSVMTLISDQLLIHL